MNSGITSESQSTARPSHVLPLLRLAGGLLFWPLLLVLTGFLEGRAAGVALLLASLGTVLTLVVNFITSRRVLSSLMSFPAPAPEASPEAFDWPLVVEEPFLRRRARRSLLVFLFSIGVMFLAIAVMPLNDLTAGARALVSAAALLIPALGWLAFPTAPALELSPSGLKVGREWLPFSGAVSVSFDDAPLWHAISVPPVPFRVKVASGEVSVSFRPHSYVWADSPSTTLDVRPDWARNHQDTLRFRTLIQGLLLLASQGNARGWLNMRFPLPRAHEGLDESSGEAAQRAPGFHPVVAAFLMVVVLLALFAVVVAAAFRLFGVTALHGSS